MPGKSPNTVAASWNETFVLAQIRRGFARIPFEFHASLVTNSARICIRGSDRDDLYASGGYRGHGKVRTGCGAAVPLNYLWEEWGAS